MKRLFEDAAGRLALRTSKESTDTIRSCCVETVLNSRTYPPPHNSSSLCTRAISPFPYGIPFNASLSQSSLLFRILPQRIPPVLRPISRTVFVLHQVTYGLGKWRSYKSFRSFARFLCWGEFLTSVRPYSTVCLRSTRGFHGCRGTLMTTWWSKFKDFIRECVKV